MLQHLTQAITLEIEIADRKFMLQNTPREESGFSLIVIASSHIAAMTAPP
jgi:hypothetical protein